MKKFALLFALVAMTSCGASYQQIASIASPQMKLTESGKYVYRADGISLDYNFWAEKGVVYFILNNDTETDVYLDLARSFLIFNGMTLDYFQNRTFKTTYAAEFGKDPVGAINKDVIRHEKEGVWIPAHASRAFSNFTIINGAYRECGLARNPKKKENMTKTYTKDNSPFKFDNMLMLVINGQEKRLVNSFYVDRITNIREDLVMEEEDILNCDGDESGDEIDVNTYMAANRLYNKYWFKKGRDHESNDDRTE